VVVDIMELCQSCSTHKKKTLPFLLPGVEPSVSHKRVCGVWTIEGFRMDIPARAGASSKIIMVMHVI
jgi:hypothetical protein